MNTAAMNTAIVNMISNQNTATCKPSVMAGIMRDCEHVPVPRWVIKLAGVMFVFLFMTVCATMFTLVYLMATLNADQAVVNAKVKEMDTTVKAAAESASDKR